MVYLHVNEGQMLNVIVARCYIQWINSIFTHCDLPMDLSFYLLTTGEGTENDLSLVGCMRHWAVYIVCQFHA